jgi:hypothetical protein
MTLKGQYFEKPKKELYSVPGRTTYKFYFSGILKELLSAYSENMLNSEKSIKILAYLGK